MRVELNCTSNISPNETIWHFFQKLPTCSFVTVEIPRLRKTCNLNEVQVIESQYEGYTIDYPVGHAVFEGEDLFSSLEEAKKDLIVLPKKHRFRFYKNQTNNTKRYIAKSHCSNLSKAQALRWYNDNNYDLLHPTVRKVYFKRR